MDRDLRAAALAIAATISMPGSSFALHRAQQALGGGKSNNTSTHTALGSSLSTLFDDTIPGDVASAGATLRGNGVGSIALSGIPDSSEVIAAYLYWSIILDAVPASSSGTFRGSLVTGELIGFSSSPCWSPPFHGTYRANVAGLFPGNGSHGVSFADSGDPDMAPSVEGAGLLVIYRNEAEPQRRILVQDGNHLLNGGTITNTLSGLDVPSHVERARVTLVVTDGQAWGDQLSFNGSFLGGSNVFSAFWQHRSFDIAHLLTKDLTFATATLHAIENETGFYDCLVWVATVLSVDVCPPVEELSFFDPTTTGWSVPDQLGPDDVGLAGENVRVRILLTEPIDSVADFDGCLELRAFNQHSDAEKWHRMTVNDDDALVGDNKEIRMLIRRDELASLGLLATGNDDVKESSSADIASDAPWRGSSRNDSDAFDVLAGLVPRGAARGGGMLTPTKLELPFSADFVRAGGVSFLEARVGDVHSAVYCPVQAQADEFYVSSHGRHGDGTLGNTSFSISVRSMDVEWREDTDIVIVAGCSVLDINDYNGHFHDDSSPGIAWSSTGPRLFLGYNATAPLDEHGLLRRRYTARIVAEYFGNRRSGQGVPLSWLMGNQAQAYAAHNANHPGQRAYNSCAIQIQTPSMGSVYYYWDQLGVMPTVVAVPESSW